MNDRHAIQSTTEVDNLSFTMKPIADTIPVTAKYIGLTLFNNTSQNTHYGERFHLQYYNDSAWVDIIPEKPLLIHDIAYKLDADKQSNYKYNLWEGYNYKPGRYKLSTEITLTLETSFSVSAKTNDDMSSDTIKHGVVMNLKNNVLKETSDTITFFVQNNTSVEVFPLEHFFIQRYDKTDNNWLNYYSISYNSENKRQLDVGKSTEFTIVFDDKHKSKAVTKNGKYFLPGKYQICKYVSIPVSAEFIFSSDNAIAEKYKKILEEKTSEN